MRLVKKFLKVAGPGVITGAADDDPSGIATYAQTGAQFGYTQLWTALFMLPFLIAVQEACGRIGAVTEQGLAGVIKTNYSKAILMAVVFLILIANIINIGADIGAMAAAANLLVPINFKVLALSFAIVIVFLEVFLCYKTYAKLLKFLCLSLLAYPLTAIIVKQPWSEILRATIIPHVQFDFEFLFIITGVFGTTISPYMFIWQANQVVEEKREKFLLNGNKNSHSHAKFIKTLRLDNFLGMLFSEITTWAIIVVSATVLHTHGITNVETAADAAKALEPLVNTFPHAGVLAKFIFSVGIIGLGFLCVPILAASAAYALTAAFNFPEGLNLTFYQGRHFYCIIIFATLIGLIMDFMQINPMKALVYAAVLNGIVAVPLLFLIFCIGKNKNIMGRYSSSRYSSLMVCIAFICMLIAALAMLSTFFFRS